MNTDDDCCLGLANQHAVSCNQSKQEVTRVDILLSKIMCNWHNIILPNPLSAIARVRHSCSLFVMQV